MAGVRKSFGATDALKTFPSRLSPPRFTRFIGENGAGKSTLMKILSGACQPDADRSSWTGNRSFPGTRCTPGAAALP